MSSNTRAKMVAGAADLMSRRGVNATSMRDVVRHTGTPRGSIGHHFPGGKQQLIEDALVFAGSQVSGPLKSLTEQHGAIRGLRAFIALWRQTLERSKFQAGCPVLAVAVEQYVNDATEKDGIPDQAAQKRLLVLAEGVFADGHHDHGDAARGRDRGPRAAACGVGHRIAGRHGRNVPGRAQRPAARRCQAGARTGAFERAAEVGRDALPSSADFRHPMERIERD
jgi:AcrR family transcriptional regulator